MLSAGVSLRLSISPSSRIACPRSMARALETVALIVEQSAIFRAKDLSPILREVYRQIPFHGEYRMCANSEMILLPK